MPVDVKMSLSLNSLNNKDTSRSCNSPQAMVEELERKLQEANRKGLEEAENTATVSQQGEGEEEGGEEGQQAAAGDEGQEEGPLGDGGEKESGGELDKENEPAEFLPPVTPANSELSPSAREYTIEPLYCGHLGDLVKCPV